MKADSPHIPRPDSLFFFKRNFILHIKDNCNIGMMEVAAHVWRKKISSGLIRWLCLSFTSEIGPVLVITSKTITTQKPKLEIQNVEVFLSSVLSWMTRVVSEFFQLSVVHLRPDDVPT
jgi:hypothetical protein